MTQDQQIIHMNNKKTNRHAIAYWLLLVVIIVLFINAKLQSTNAQRAQDALLYEVERNYVDQRNSISQWVEMVKQWRALIASWCEWLPSEARTQTDIYYCGE